MQHHHPREIVRHFLVCVWNHQRHVNAQADDTNQEFQSAALREQFVRINSKYRHVHPPDKRQSLLIPVAVSSQLRLDFPENMQLPLFLAE